MRLKLRPPRRMLPRRLDRVKRRADFPMSIEAILLLAGVVAIRIAYGWRHPYTACGRCEGGKHWDAKRENWRNCGKCEGSGKKIRLTRRILGPDGL